MTNLKRSGALVVLLVAFSLIVAACGSSGEDTTTTTEATTEETTTTAAATEETTTTAAEAMIGEGVTIGMAYDIGGRGDQSFNDSAAAGLDQAKTDYGVDSQELEPTAGGENREENLRLLAEAGYPLNFAIGFAFADGVAATAPDFPDVDFAIIDSVVDQPNVASLVFAEHEGSALVGAAAGLMTQTDIIGFIGGVNVPLIQKFELGYKWGAEQVNPDVDVLVQYLTEPPDFAGFNDPAAGKEAALGMYEQGADIVYHAAGGSGAGLFEAAKETSEAGDTKVWAIGVDSDQYNTADPSVQDYILTSMLKRVDVAVYTTITNFLTEGEQAGVLVFDLAADGVGYSTSGDFLPADVIGRMDDLRAEIIADPSIVPQPIGA
jgi:basic membrane protein A and related proteins